MRKIYINLLPFQSFNLISKFIRKSLIMLNPKLTIHSILFYFQTHCRYGIMLSCWSNRKRDRPSFSKIAEQLKDIVNQLGQVNLLRIINPLTIFTKSV